MDNMRERIAARKKKKQMADEATKSSSSKGKPSEGTENATVDDEGRKLAKCLGRALQDCVGDMGDMEDATTADCAALRPVPLALKLAKVYKPCALVVQKTELIEGVCDTHGMRPRMKTDIVDWLVRVLYMSGYCSIQVR